jgi:hypothetical protein
MDAPFLFAYSHGKGGDALTEERIGSDRLQDFARL